MSEKNTGSWELEWTQNKWLIRVGGFLINILLATLIFIASSTKNDINQSFKDVDSDLKLINNNYADLLNRVIEINVRQEMQTEADKRQDKEIEKIKIELSKK